MEDKNNLSHSIRTPEGYHLLKDEFISQYDLAFGQAKALADLKHDDNKPLTPQEVFLIYNVIASLGHLLMLNQNYEAGYEFHGKSGFEMKKLS